jgi:tungstate transport system ATP-binding protein
MVLDVRSRKHFPSGGSHVDRFKIASYGEKGSAVVAGIDNGEGSGGSVTLVELKDLEVVRAGTTLLTIPSMKVRSGEVLAVIGPNGAGKTTLLQTICGLLRPRKGEILFEGKRVGQELDLYAYRRKVTMVFQEPLLFDTTVFENVSAGLRFRGVGGKVREKVVEENLARFGIGHLRNRSARTLSGGEAQRTSLARAFATGPEVLLLDEPFGALDAPTRESILEDLHGILRDSRITALFATHDRAEALRLSDSVSIMKAGRIVQTGTPEEVMNRPVDEFVASFVGMETILSGQVMRREEDVFVIDVAGSHVEVAGSAVAGEQVTICVRPENVTICRLDGQGATSARNVFKGRIEKIDARGFYYRIQLDCGFPLVAYVTGSSVRDLGLREGALIGASFKATAIHVVSRRNA